MILLHFDGNFSDNLIKHLVIFILLQDSIWLESIRETLLTLWTIFSKSVKSYDRLFSPPWQLRVHLCWSLVILSISLSLALSLQPLWFFWLLPKLGWVSKHLLRLVVIVPTYEAWCWQPSLVTFWLALCYAMVCMSLVTECWIIYGLLLRLYIGLYFLCYGSLSDPIVKLHGLLGISVITFMIQHLYDFCFII